MSFDVEAVRREFPILSRQVNGKPLVYLDSAASAQKPRAVLAAMTAAAEGAYANVHRGLHTLANEATEAYEAARESVAGFLNAASPSEIVFTKGATEAINLVAAGLFDRIQPGDEIVVSITEHHANIVPWHFLRERRGAVLRFIPVTDDGRLDLDAYRGLLGPRTRVVAVSHMSNVLGTINPVAEIVGEARAAGALTLVDGAQAVVHQTVDVQAIGADFYVFSGHKLYGPTGIGVLHGRGEALADLPPYQGGGEMIASVALETITYAEPPHRFEAGTPPILEAAGLAAAIEWIARPRPRRRRRARGGAIPPAERAARGRQLAKRTGDGARQGGDLRLHRRGRPPPRYRPSSGQPWCGHPRRHALRRAADAPLRADRQRPGVVRPI